jgi:RNA polymerase-binding transcription factor DksA
MKRPRKVKDVVGRGSNKSVAGTTSRDVFGATSSESLAGRINSKWAWHFRVLGKLRERLLQDRRERLAEAAQPLEPHSMNHADSATDEFDHNLALATLSAKQDALHEINEAISRVLNGSYGVCEETGKPIPIARLKAIPWTRFVQEVEARLEKDGDIQRPHLGSLGSIRGAPTGSLGPIKSAEDTDDDESPATDEVLRNHLALDADSEVESRKRRRGEQRDIDDEPA